MKKTFTTELYEKQLQKTIYLAIATICIGIILFFLKDFSQWQGYKTIGNYIDGLLLPSAGIFLYFLKTNELKKVEGGFIAFDNNRLQFRSRDTETTFDKLDQIQSINIKLKTIELTDENDETFSIFLDDYTTTQTKKEIKATFEAFQQQMVKK